LKDATAHIKPLAAILKTIRLIISFYKSFAFTSNLITIVCIGLILYYGEKGIHILQPLIWFKLFTLFTIVYVINSYKRNEFYYYRNLGLSKLKLWIPILSFDFVIFLISVIMIAKAAYEAHPGN